MSDDQVVAVATEEVEGIGDEDAGWGDYPIDTVLIRNETRTVHDVLRRIEKGTVVMDPDFQREFIWPDDKQSKLIESVLMRVPLPVFYLAEDPQGRLIVVDGLQRLSTFRRFVSNQVRLKLPDQEALHRKRFQDLSPKLQNRIEDCNLIFYVIDAKVPERARLDIFERVNSGIPLTRQQMRNSLYAGPATRFLKEEASTQLFLEATGKSLRISTMRDREFINRFCGFQLLGVEGYKDDMDEFLATTLKRKGQPGAVDLAGLSAQFRNGLLNNLKVFGKHAFRRHQAGQEGRSPINASLWDVMSTGLSRYAEHLVEARKEALVDTFHTMMQEPSFTDSITSGTNDLKKVQYRFRRSRRLLREVFGDHPA
jgi:hypothetical protein